MHPDTGREILKEVSQHTNTTLRELAAHLVQWPRSTRLPQDIRSALDVAVKSRTSSDVPAPQPPDDDLGGP
ncbi:hypothetical protein [Streptomyces sp. NPDC048521]|uniref:hypothetical protein n=1 Tax=Streptomyces sp. NPDC048521 TaxID=3365566 RepID=UPI003724AD3F